MTYSIVNDKLAGPNVAHVGTKKTSGKMTPKFLVIHYTAGDNYESDVRTLSSSDRKASAHLVVAPDGRMTQIGDFKDALWQAGQSVWKGYIGLNKHSIGIEIVCPGPIDGDQARFGEKYKTQPSPYAFTGPTRSRNGGPERVWAIFTDAQIDVLKDVGELLMTTYGLKEAVGHDQIAPTRKIDPGPSCPQSVFEYLNGNKDDEDEIERPELPSGAMLKVKGVAPDTLTFRASPNGEKRGELPENAVVEEISRQGKWVQVRTPAGYVGWLYGSYLVAA